MPVIVTFKAEATDALGAEAGPVTVVDTDAMDRDPVMSADKVGMPYGYEPEWRTDLGWMSLADAKVVAGVHGVELTIG